MTHEFVTDGQVRYIRAFCELVAEAMYNEDDGEEAIDMDAVADQSVEGTERPAFYYAEESQQNKYNCKSCSDVNDILGRYGFCSCCGTHNGLQELQKELGELQDRVDAGSQFEDCVKGAIAAFDSYARQISKQLVRSIPMTPKRKKEWQRKLFHNLQARSEELLQVFDIDVLKKLGQDDLSFVTLMFHRRHVYEHNGGEVDEKYLADSGDENVRLKQALREDRHSATRTLELVQRLAKNLHSGFHSIFPREDGVPERRPTR